MDREDLTADQLAWLSLDFQVLEYHLAKFRGIAPPDEDFERKCQGLKLHSLFDNALEMPSKLYILAFLSRKPHHSRSNLCVYQIIQGQPGVWPYQKIGGGTASTVDRYSGSQVPRRAAEREQEDNDVGDEEQGEADENDGEYVEDEMADSSPNKRSEVRASRGNSGSVDQNRPGSRGNTNGYQVTSQIPVSAELQENTQLRMWQGVGPSANKLGRDGHIGNPKVEVSQYSSNQGAKLNNRPESASSNARKLSGSENNIKRIQSNQQLDRTSGQTQNELERRPKERQISSKKPISPANQSNLGASNPYTSAERPQNKEREVGNSKPISPKPPTSQHQPKSLVTSSISQPISQNRQPEGRPSSSQRAGQTPKNNQPNVAAIGYSREDGTRGEPVVVDCQDSIEDSHYKAEHTDQEPEVIDSPSENREAEEADGEEEYFEEGERLEDEEVFQRYDNSTQSNKSKEPRKKPSASESNIKRGNTGSTDAPVFNYYHSSQLPSHGKSAPKLLATHKSLNSSGIRRYQDTSPKDLDSAYLARSPPIANDPRITAKMRTLHLPQCNPPKGISRTVEESEEESSEDSVVNRVFKQAGIAKSSEGGSKGVKGIRKNFDTSFGAEEVPATKLGRQRTLDRARSGSRDVDLEAREGGIDPSEERLGWSKVRLITSLNNCELENKTMATALINQQTELNELKEVATLFNGKNKELKDKFKEMKTMNKGLIKQLEEVAKENTELVSSLNQYSENMRSLQEEASRMKLELESKSRQTRDLSKDLDRARSQLKDHTQNHSTVKEELFSVKKFTENHTRELEAKLRMMENQYSTLQENWNREKNAKERAQADIQELTTKNTNLHHMLENFKLKSSEAELALHKKTTELEAQHRHVTDIHHKLDLKDAEAQLLRTDITSLKAKLASTSEGILTANVERVKLEEKLRHVLEDKAAVTTTILKLEKATGEMEEMKNKSREHIVEIERLKRELEIQVAKNAKIKDLKKENQDQQAKFAELNLLLHQAEERIEKLSLEFLTLKSDHERKERENDTLRQKLDFVSDQKSQLEKALTERKKAEEELQSDLRDFQSNRENNNREYEALNNRYKSSKMDNKNLLKENEQLSEKIGTLEEEVKKLQEQLASSMRVKEKRSAISDIKGLIDNHRGMLESIRGDYLGPTSGPRASSTTRMTRK